MKSAFNRIILIIPVTLILSILPIPEILAGFRPPWVCIFLLYLQYFLPRHFNVIIVLILGLCLDALLSTVMGEHAFALLFTTWIANTKERRFQFFSMSQQMALIGLFCFIYQIVLLLIDAFLGFNYMIWSPLSTGILAVLLWPWTRLLLDEILLMRMRYR